jgi:hypothetical protein
MRSRSRETSGLLKGISHYSLNCKLRSIAVAGALLCALVPLCLGVSKHRSYTCYFLSGRAKTHNIAPVVGG